MPENLLLIVGGLLLLGFGGSSLVRGASALAVRLGVPPLLVGLTVVAWGTSAPELAVTLGAAWRGQSDLALGNVVGSNIFNVVGVLGAAALVAPLVVSKKLVRRDVPLVIALSVSLYVVGFDGCVGRIDGTLLLLAGIGYTIQAVIMSRRETAATASATTAESGSRPPWLPQLGWIGTGLAALTLGATALVSGATAVARAMGVSELVIGLTVVAAGTSLPEVAASMAAAWRGEREIAVGNVIGSNIFNLTAVLGPVALVAGGVAVPPAALGLDIPVMIAAALVCLPVFYVGHDVSRWEGAGLLVCYAAYTTRLVLAAQQHPWLDVFDGFLLLVVVPLAVAGLCGLSWKEWRSRRATR